MQTLPDITDLPPAPDLASASTLKERITNFLNALPGMVTQFRSLIAAQNILSGQIQSAADAADASKTAAAVSELNATSAANFQGAWVSSRVVGGVTLNGYTQGQSVLDPNGVFQVCLITHTTAQNPTSTTGYWVPNVALGSVGDVRLTLASWNTKRSLPSDLTITRASTIQVINRYGRMVSVATNTAAYKREGLVIEGQVTNSLLYSDDFTNAAWSKTGVVVNSSTETWLDGTQTYYKLDCSSATDHIFQVTASLPAGTYTLPFYIRKGSVDKVSVAAVGQGVIFDSVRYDFSLDTFSIGNNSGTAYGARELLPNGDLLLSLTVTTTASGTISARIYPIGNSTDTSGYCYAKGAGVRNEAFPTSHITTTTAAVTRAYNQIPFTVNDIIPNLAKKWSLVIDLTLKCRVPVGSNQYLIGAYTSASEYFGVGIFDNNVMQCRVVSEGVPHLATTLALTPNTKYRVAYTYNNGLFKCYVNGVLVSTANNTKFARPPTLPTTGALGGLITTGNHSNALLERIDWYDLDLTAAEVAIA